MLRGVDISRTSDLVFLPLKCHEMQVGKEANTAAAPLAAAPEIDLDHDYSVGDQHLPRKRLLIREWGEEGGQDRITTRHHKTARWNILP